MFYVVVLAVGILLGCLEFLIFDRRKKFLPISIIKLIFGSNIFALITAFLSCHFINGMSVFPISAHTLNFMLFYIACEVGFGLVWIFVTGIIDSKIEISVADESDVPKKKKRRRTALKIISVVLAALGTAAFTGTIWAKSTFGDLAPDEMFITMISPTDGTSSEVMNTLFSQPVLQTASVTFFFALFVFSKRQITLKRKKKDITFFTPFVRRLTAFILALAMLAGGIAYGVKKLRLITLVKMYTQDSPIISENYVDPRDTKMEFPEKKRNLIHIYLESMENSYLSKDMGGYIDENLLAPLTDLAQADKGYVFSNTDNFFGGPMSTTGCTWSVASMVCQNAGVPMKVPVDGNKYGTPGNFLSGAVMLGDILNAMGYEQSLMFGATATFGGLRYMYDLHGKYNIIDYDAAKEKGLIPQDYMVYWGYEDDKLYEFAKDEITRMYNTGKPFNFVMETADTHFPDGYVGPNTPRTRDSQYADVIAYSASEVTKFINWIKEQPFYENTTIVLIGDHLSMDKKFFDGWDQNYTRTQFNLILNPATSVRDIPAERLHNRYWASFDYYPTILASIGVKIDGERLGLGTNLFSGEQTLFERNGGLEGWKYANEEFNTGSMFYNTHILKPAYKEFSTKNITEYKN